MALQFPAPSKTTVIGDGNEFIVWEGLPVPTRFQTLQVLQGAQDDFLVEDGRFEANFNPPGIYEWTLSADGYDSALVTITANEPAPLKAENVEEGK